MTRGAFAGVRERFAQAGRPLSGHQSLSITLAMVAVGIALPLLAILPPFSGFGTQDARTTPVAVLDAGPRGRDQFFAAT